MRCEQAAGPRRDRDERAPGRVVDEGGEVGQHRLEVDATGDTAGYFLHVLEGTGAADARLTATLVDGGTAWVVTLAHPTDGTVTIRFEKGMSSTGGSITIGGVERAFLERVQGISVTPDAPVWEALPQE